MIAPCKCHCCSIREIYQSYQQCTYMCTARMLTDIYSKWVRSWGNRHRPRRYPGLIMVATRYSPYYAITSASTPAISPFLSHLLLAFGLNVEHDSSVAPTVWNQETCTSISVMQSRSAMCPVDVLYSTYGGKLGLLGSCACAGAECATAMPLGLDGRGQEWMRFTSCVCMPTSIGP